jgi:hypothetical protein
MAERARGDAGRLRRPASPAGAVARAAVQMG